MVMINGWQPKDSDTSFATSEDVGPRCLCSRCGQPITKGIPFRAWTESGLEYRYHLKCVGFQETVDDKDDQ